MTQEYERITKLTYHQVRYLGERHSHPNMSNSPGEADKKQFNELLIQVLQKLTMSCQEYIAQWNRLLTNYVSLTPGIIVGRLCRQRDKRFVQFE